MSAAAVILSNVWSSEKLMWSIFFNSTVPSMHAAAPEKKVIKTLEKNFQQSKQFKFENMHLHSMLFWYSSNLLHSHKPEVSDFKCSDTP